MIEIVCRTEDHAVVLEARGDLTATSAEVVRSCVMAAAVGAERSVVLDITDAGEMDDAVMAVLRELKARLLVKTGHELEVRSAGATIPLITADLPVSA